MEISELIGSAILLAGLVFLFFKLKEVEKNWAGKDKKDFTNNT